MPSRRGEWEDMKSEEAYLILASFCLIRAKGMCVLKGQGG